MGASHSSSSRARRKGGAIEAGRRIIQRCRGESREQAASATKCMAKRLKTLRVKFVTKSISEPRAGLGVLQKLGSHFFARARSAYIAAALAALRPLDRFAPTRF